MKELNEHELLVISGGFNEGAYDNGVSFGRNLRKAVDYCTAWWPVAEKILRAIP